MTRDGCRVASGPADASDHENLGSRPLRCPVGWVGFRRAALRGALRKHVAWRARCPGLTARSRVRTVQRCPGSRQRCWYDGQHPGRALSLQQCRFITGGPSLSLVLVPSERGQLDPRAQVRRRRGMGLVGASDRTDVGWSVAMHARRHAASLSLSGPPWPHVWVGFQRERELRPGH
jgi:hypothetical protein